MTEKTFEQESSYLRALLYAFGLGLIGVVLWVLIGGFAEFISAWIALIIALGIKHGYEKGNGPKGLKIITLLVVYVIQIFLATYLMYFIMLNRIPGVELGLFQVIEFLSEPVLRDAVMDDMVLIGVFALLGLVFLFINNIGRNRARWNHGESQMEANMRNPQMASDAQDDGE